MIKDRKSAFRVDLEKYYTMNFGTISPPLTKKFKLWLVQFGLHCVAVYRFGQFSRRLFRKNRIIGWPFVLIHKFLDYFMKFFHQVHIDTDLIGPGFYISHVGTIYIGPTTIGDNLSIAHNVTIGWGYSKGKSGIPLIGNNVWIGTGSVLYGSIVIGNGVTICNGCILSQNVPDCCLVGGNPGRVIMKDFDPSLLFRPPRLNSSFRDLISS